MKLKVACLLAVWLVAMVAAAWAAEVASCVPAYEDEPPAQPEGGMEKCDDQGTTYYSAIFPGKCNGAEQVAWCREDGTVDMQIHSYWYKKIDEDTCERQGPNPVNPDDDPGVDPVKTVAQCDDPNH